MATNYTWLAKIQADALASGTPLQRKMSFRYGVVKGISLYLLRRKLRDAKRNELRRIRQIRKAIQKELRRL